MSADALLSRLDNVRSTGRDTWLARCPAHEDRRPSLSIRELDDGRILLHCFAECAAADILAAIGLDFDALFPERVDHHRAPVRPHFPAGDVLCAVSREALIVAILASQMADGYEISAEDHARLIVAAGRLIAAVDVAGLDREGERIRRILTKSRGAAMDLDAAKRRKAKVLPFNRKCETAVA